MEEIWNTFDALYKTLNSQGRRVEELERRVAELERRLSERADADCGRCEGSHDPSLPCVAMSAEAEDRRALRA